MSRTELRSTAVRWIDLLHPSEAELTAIREEFGFHPLDIADCRKQGQRQKVERYREYAFLVMLFPVFKRKEREIEQAEVDFFVGNDYVITVHDGKLPPLVALRKQFETDETLRTTIAGISTVLVQEIVERLEVSLYPMLDHVSLDIRNAEQKVFSGKEKEMVEEIALLRRNITDFRRIVQTHKNTLKRLVDILKLNNLSGSQESVLAFERTIDRTKEIWDLLESYRESIDTVYETNHSLISYRLNGIMKTFTTMSVVIFLMTLIATLFSVRANGTPFLDRPFAFWAVLATMLVAGFTARQFFKRRRLLE